MNMHEAKDRKAQLQNDLLHLVQAFEQESGCKVIGLVVNRSNFLNPNDYNGAATQVSATVLLP